MSDGRKHRHPYRGQVYARPGILVDARGRLPRLYEVSRYDPQCPGCLNPDAQHAEHRPIGECIPDLVRGAIPWAVAAAKCGVTRYVVKDWLKRGGAEIEAMIEDGRDEPLERDAVYVAFTEAVLVAQGDAQATQLSRWQNAARKDWRGVAAYMAEVWPEQFGKSSRQVVEVVGPGGQSLGPVLSLDEIEAQIATRLARLERTSVIDTHEVGA